MTQRILHIGKYFPPFAGGIENFLADLIPVQIEQGYTVAALVHDHIPSLSRTVASVQPEPYAPLPHFLLYRVPSYGRLLYAPVSPHFPLWFKKVLDSFRPTVLHLHLPNTSAFFALWLTAAQRIPWIIHWHADVISTVERRLSLAYHLYRPFEQKLLSRARAIIATSQPYLDSSVALHPWRDKCHIVPLGTALARLPVPDSETIRWAEQQWLPGKVRILTVGRLTYYKGQTVLVRAMAEVKGAQSILVGQGEQRTYLETLIAQLSLNTVKLLGYCDNTQLIGLLATCDVFCLPSLERTEAFGVVLMEAMRYGKPIVASAIPGSGVGWVVEHQKNGLLVAPNSIPDLINALQHIIKESDLRLHLGQNGYQRFIELFDIRPVALKISQIYYKMC